jgi:electron transport complex protein RnfD
MNHLVNTSILRFLAAICPAVCCSIYFFGLDAIRLISICVITSVIFDLAFHSFTRTIRTHFDASPLITGLLLAMCLPPQTPCYVAIIGSFFAMVVAKSPFGGYSKNIFNPVLAARVFLLFFFTSPMATWTLSSWNVSAGDIEMVTTATPLTNLKFYSANFDWSNFDVVKDLFFGNTNGSLGETSSLALIVGGIILFITKTVSPAIPLSYILTVALFSLLCGNVSPLIEIFSGGLLLGAIFIASDNRSAPSSIRGKIIFGFGCGILTMLIRRLPNSSFPEGVAFAILIMNAATPLIDSFSFSAVSRNKV